jgi:hypothetical protein
MFAPLLFSLILFPNANLKALSVSKKSVASPPAPDRPAVFISSQQQQQLQQQRQQQPQSFALPERQPIPPPSSAAPAASDPFAPSPLVSSFTEPLAAAFPAEDGGYEPDEGAAATKKHRKKSKERQAAGDFQASKSSESAPAAVDASKPPRFRKSDTQQPLEGSKPPLQRSGSNVSTGSVGSSVSQEFAAVSTQAALLAFKAARCCAHAFCS